MGIVTLQCSCCGERRSVVYTALNAASIIKEGWGSYGSALYCPKCTRTWEERNGANRPMPGKFNTLRIIDELYIESAPKTVTEHNSECEQRYTGVLDINGVEIREGDIVRVLDANDEELMRGRIVFACGAYGLYLVPYIDWEKLETLIAEITGCNNSPCFCYNDNFISLWELCWNFCNDVDYDNCPVLEIMEEQK